MTQKQHVVLFWSVMAIIAIIPIIAAIAVFGGDDEEPKHQSKVVATATTESLPTDNVRVVKMLPFEIPICLIAAMILFAAIFLGIIKDSVKKACFLLFGWGLVGAAIVMFITAKSTEVPYDNVPVIQSSTETGVDSAIEPSTTF